MFINISVRGTSVLTIFLLNRRSYNRTYFHYSAQAVFGSFVWAFRRLKNTMCREMSARGYALHSVCTQLFFHYGNTYTAWWRFLAMIGWRSPVSRWSHEKGEVTRYIRFLLLHPRPLLISLLSLRTKSYSPSHLQTEMIFYVFASLLTSNRDSVDRAFSVCAPKLKHTAWMNQGIRQCKCL